MTVCQRSVNGLNYISRSKISSIKESFMMNIKQFLWQFQKSIVIILPSALLKQFILCSLSKQKVSGSPLYFYQSIVHSLPENVRMKLHADQFLHSPKCNDECSNMKSTIWCNQKYMSFPVFRSILINANVDS